MKQRDLFDTQVDLMDQLHEQKSPLWANPTMLDKAKESAKKFGSGIHGLITYRGRFHAHTQTVLLGTGLYMRTNGAPKRLSPAQAVQLEHHAFGMQKENFSKE